MMSDYDYVFRVRSAGQPIKGDSQVGKVNGVVYSVCLIYF